MERYNSLVEFMEKYDNVSFMASNVPLILENLKKADQAGCLKQFLLNKKPYRSAFTFFVFNDNNKAARGTDQVAIVFALNLYGAENPGFAQRLNETMKELAKGSMKQARRVIVLLRAQMELQELELSLINFVDKELVLLTNKKIKRSKGPMVALMIICIFGFCFLFYKFCLLDKEIDSLYDNYVKKLEDSYKKGVIYEKYNFK